MSCLDTGIGKESVQTGLRVTQSLAKVGLCKIEDLILAVAVRRYCCCKSNEPGHDDQGTTTRVPTIPFLACDPLSQKKRNSPVWVGVKTATSVSLNMPSPSSIWIPDSGA